MPDVSLRGRSLLVRGPRSPWRSISAPVGVLLHDPLARRGHASGGRSTSAQSLPAPPADRTNASSTSAPKIEAARIGVEASESPGLGQPGARLPLMWSVVQTTTVGHAGPATSAGLPKGEPVTQTERLFEGVRVVEFGLYAAVPYAAELFAHGGADVVKVEPIGGENTRHNSPIAPMEGRQYIIKARGKRAITLDLKAPEGLAAAKRLIARSDVVLANMRPGAMERLGLGYDDISAEHPGIVYGEISAFGTEGPEGNKPGVDPIVQSGAGLVAAAGSIEDGVPAPNEALLADYMSGTLLAFGVVSAVRLRERTGRGQRVTTSLLQASLALMHAQANVFHAVDGWKPDFVRWLQEEHPPFEEASRRRRSHSSPRAWWLNTYETADGVVTIGAPGPLRQALVEVTGVQDPAVVDPDWTMPDDPLPYIADVTAQARAAMRSFKTDDLLARLDAAGIPCSRVRFMEEVVLGEHARANRYVYTADHPRVGPMTLPTPPVQFSDSQYEAAANSPAYAEHTGQVLAELGFTEGEIEALRASGVAVLAD